MATIEAAKIVVLVGGPLDDHATSAFDREDSLKVIETRTFDIQEHERDVKKTTKVHYYKRFDKRHIFSYDGCGGEK